ncbi:sterol desaturase family protein [Arenibacter sp. M-2]|uniref:sterol desaturase family protein n=1 Tax=unclassified Arenibacter TaxID=2615047 RepID=UPI000D752001|nr:MULTISPECIES: sterol desaturase family protein [unclassified Arenibacter]MDL5510672.1 sterol desaturase family protein [Arenibacter sp. M-2]PXX26734.1 sterol desaturase/sphingolipid hydroxylase (fatty acid hydroxylase superfamily) [Arenibacter sp. ARW7G5Y1]
MEAIYNYFETIPPAHRSVILVSGIAFFWTLEYIIPLFQLKYSKLKHAGVNLFFTLTTILVNIPLAFLLLKTSDWTIANNFGILQWLPVMPLWGKVLLGVMMLDFLSAWLAHWVEHRVKVLWGFHLIHHTDHEVDTTTANRHHPGESVVRFIFTCFGTFVVGAPIAIIMIYQALSVVLSQFNHANISLPKKLDEVLSWVIVSPDMHKVHHHYKLPYTDSNYGNIFSIWDRLLGTFMRLSNNDIIYGVDTYPNEKENSDIGALLKIPFKPYKSPKKMDITSTDQL